MLHLQSSIWAAFGCSWRQLKERSLTSKLSFALWNALLESQALPCCKPTLTKSKQLPMLPSQRYLL